MRIAVVGDQHATYLPASHSKGIHGLPAWDMEFKQMIEEIIPQDFDRIYISPGFYLMGVKKADEVIGALARGNIAVQYEQKERGFYSRSNWRQFIKNEAGNNYLWAAWKEAVKDLYNLSDKIWLLPISMYWYELKIKENIVRLYPKFCSEFSRLINVAAVFQGNRFYHKNRYGHLTGEAISLLQPMLENG